MNTHTHTHTNLIKSLLHPHLYWEHRNRCQPRVCQRSSSVLQCNASIRPWVGPSAACISRFCPVPRRPQSGRTRLQTSSTSADVSEMPQPWTGQLEFRWWRWRGEGAVTKARKMKNWTVPVLSCLCLQPLPVPVTWHSQEDSLEYLKRMEIFWSLKSRTTMVLIEQY